MSKKIKTKLKNKILGMNFLITYIIKIILILLYDSNNFDY